MCINFKNILFFLVILITSCNEIIFVEDISEETINIILPKDKDTLKQGIVDFNWEDIEDAEYYELQIVIPNFEDITKSIEDTLISKSNFSKEMTTGKYEWRIRALNSNYYSKYSTHTLIIEE